MNSPAGAGLADSVGDIDALLERGAAESLESLCRDVVEQAPVGIGFVNRDGSYRSCNRAFGELLGFSADDIVEQTLSSVTHAEDLAASLEGFERLWRGEIALLDLEKRCRARMAASCGCVSPPRWSAAAGSSRMRGRVRARHLGAQGDRGGADAEPDAAGGGDCRIAAGAACL